MCIGGPVRADDEHFEEADVHQSVHEAFIPLSTTSEGPVNHMYLDITGLVSVGMATSSTPVELALALPFLHKEGGSRRGAVAAA